jgi:hypothetical protein
MRTLHIFERIAIAKQQHRMRICGQKPTDAHCHARVKSKTFDLFNDIRLRLG